MQGYRIKFQFGEPIAGSQIAVGYQLSAVGKERAGNVELFPGQANEQFRSLSIFREDFPARKANSQQPRANGCVSPRYS
ncbi:MAG: hypothetical protein AB7W47_17230 [Calditrichaceae bacterium]